MLMHRLLGRHAAPQPQPKKQERVTYHAELRLCDDTGLGVALRDTMCITYHTREELHLKVRRALRLDGVNLVRIGSTEYRLNTYGDLYEQDVWGRAV